MDRESEVSGDGGACMERWGKGHMHVIKCRIKYYHTIGASCVL